MSAQADLSKQASLWGKTLEWELRCPAGGVQNPFDTEAIATFVHTQTGRTRSTGIFWAGGDSWRFRFAPVEEGVWRFATQSGLPELDGLNGTVEVLPPGGGAGTGFVVAAGNKWTWQATGKAFVPQLVMYRTPDEFHDRPDVIDGDIEEFLVGHGFNGFHVPVYCRWLDIDKETHEQFESADPSPDPRTFDALELLIGKVHAAGGMVHMWMWGDNDPGHRQTPMRQDWGGKNGRVDKRLQRYLAARLGPLPGWTMGYGFDLEHWASEEDLRIWHSTMHGLLGWPHLLGGRAGSPGRDGRLRQIYDGLDYAGYTHFRPAFQDYVQALNANPRKPVMSEDRFRIRNNPTHAKKDYDQDMTRRGLWHSAMAGGVANIWGSYDDLRGGAGISHPYPNRERIETYARFFAKRFSADMVADMSYAGGSCLRSADRSRWFVYCEDADVVPLDTLGINGSSSMVAVDTRKPYEEISCAVAESESVWKAPYRSDWALAAQ